MKSIILKVIPYAIAFVLLNILCYSTSGFYKQQDKYINRIETSLEKQTETIFLGDSHAETIKLLNLSDDIGNLAFGADGIYEMYIKALIMIESNKNLKNVFIETEAQVFSNTGSSNSTFLGKYLLKVNDTLDVYNKTKLNLLTDAVPLFNDSYIGYVLNEFYSFFKSKSYKDKPDWLSLSETERKEIAIATGSSDHRSIMANEKHMEVYSAIIKLFNDNDIRVIGVRFPTSKEYIEQCDPRDKAKVDAFINSLNFDGKLDYSATITDPKYFDDEDHLNKMGIKKLAPIIFNDTGIEITK